MLYTTPTTKPTTYSSVLLAIYVLAINRQGVESVLNTASKTLFEIKINSAGVTRRLSRHWWRVYSARDIFEKDKEQIHLGYDGHGKTFE